MDALAKWSAYMVDLRTLFSEWERRRTAGAQWTKRFREIYSICMFVLCIENRSRQRYLVGFQQRGTNCEPARVGQLFEDGFGEIEGCDVMLVDDPEACGGQPAIHHRCQLVSYVNQASTSEADLVKFLEKKKLRVARDDDLRLIIHMEQDGPFNYSFLSAYLQHRTPECPYSQVFAVGQVSDLPRRWLCVQVYPEFKMLHELEETTAKALILDRKRYCKPDSLSEGQAEG